LRALLARKPARLASVALANKMARTAWALLVRQEDHRATDARLSDATAAAAT